MPPTSICDSKLQTRIHKKNHITIKPRRIIIFKRIPQRVSKCEKAIAPVSTVSNRSLGEVLFESTGLFVVVVVEGLSAVQLVRRADVAESSVGLGGGWSCTKKVALAVHYTVNGFWF